MRYLIARRIIQLSILACFAFAPNFLVMGNLSSSLWFSTIPMSDPFAVLQLFLSSLIVSAASLSSAVIIGALVALVVYGIFLGRAFCAWVCPVNLITDFAAYVRTKLDLHSKSLILSKNLRYYILALCLALSLVLGMPIFESFSYIGIIQRGLIFGSASWIVVALLIFCVDSFLSERATCSHFCPLGAFYALVAKFAFLRVKYDFSKCTKCYKCIQICPEKQVLSLVGKQSGSVHSGECIRCARCIEVCDDDALKFNIFDLRSSK